MKQIIRQLLISYLIVISFESCTYSQKRILIEYDNDLIERFKTKIDSEKIDVIKYAKKYAYCFQYDEPFKNRLSFPEENTINFKLQLNDYAAIEYLTNSAVDEYNKKEALEEYNQNLKQHSLIDSSGLNLAEFEIKLNEYYRKYIASVIDGKVYVKVYCYHSSMKDHFHKGIFEDVDGGGKLFFQLMINLNEFRHYGIEINASI